jgi:hypothetical protein
MDCISVCAAKYVGDYRIWLKFNTGESGEVDLHDLVFSHQAAEPLRDRSVFADFHLDSWPTLAWDCGFDVDPESLYERAIGRSCRLPEETHEFREHD